MILLYTLYAEAVFGFINAPYGGNEADGSVSVQVGFLGTTALERSVTIMLSYMDGTAIGKFTLSSLHKG